MQRRRLLDERLRSHRLTAPAATVAEAAAHMSATQAQEFWGGRWALAARTRGAPALSDVDAAFERGELVRSWTMRGTLHIVAAADLATFLEVTGERQARQAASMHRSLGIDDETLRTARGLVMPVLRGGNRLTRAEFAGILADGGIEPSGMRGNHVLSALAVAGDLVFGPVVPREGAPTREQYLVATDDWIGASAAPTDPVAELFVGYIRSHGPAGVADFAWWAGLPLGVARSARDAAVERVDEVDDDLFVVPDRPRRSRVDLVRALPPFEEYYLSYADRSVPCAPAFTAHIGPSLNGIVRPVLVADGEIVGTWSHSTAVGRHHLPPVPEVFEEASVDEDAVEVALEQFRRFLTS